MPRIVYGVLDVHPSHRIERPDPERAGAAGRPDACTLCHVERDRAWAIRARARLWPGKAAPPPALSPAAPSTAPEDAIDLSPRSGAFGGDPITRAVSVDALGRAPWPPPGPPRDRTARERAASLLEVVAADRYPAVRHLAARALGVVLRQWSGHDAAAATVRTYDATAPAADRDRVVADLRRHLAEGPAGGAGPEPHQLARMAQLRAAARRVDIDIGE